MAFNSDVHFPRMLSTRNRIKGGEAKAGPDRSGWGYAFHGICHLQPCCSLTDAATASVSIVVEPHFGFKHKLGP